MDGADVPDPGCAVDLAEGLVVFVVVVAVVLFLVLIGIPFLIALGELVFILLLTIGGAAGRLLFRRPWTVDAVGPGGEHQVWHVVGWGRSGAARRAVAARIAATGTPPTDAELEAALRVR